MAVEAHTTRRAFLCSLPALGAVAATQMPLDRFPSLLVEWQSMTNRLNDGEENSALYERLWEIEREMMVEPAENLFGARRRLEMFRQEFRSQYYQGGHGDDLLLSLLDQALAAVEAG